MTTHKPNPPWYHLTPDRLFIGLLVVQVFLLLSDRFQWFPFNEHKGWTVLIALGIVCVAVVVMLVWGLVCLCLRWRFQFGVRSLLVFLAAVSLPLGWFAWEVEKAKRQREAVEAIRALRCVVFYDYQVGESEGLAMRKKPTTPAWLRKKLGDDFFCEVVRVRGSGTEFFYNDARHLQELTNLEELDLCYTGFTKEDAACLLRLAELKRLDLQGTQVGDEGLDHFSAMVNLEWLDLEDAEVTDEGLVNLTALPKLETLNVSNNAITDNGLKHLHGMPKLRTLWIGDTEITDKGLDHLQTLTNLRHLDLSCTNVTDEGVKRFREALPNCKIHHGRP